MIELLRNGEKISGESLREELQLPSSNFTWEEKNGNYIFTTKGSDMALDMISITETYWQSRDRIIRKYCTILSEYHI